MENVIRMIMIAYTNCHGIQSAVVLWRRPPLPHIAAAAVSSITIINHNNNNNRNRPSSSSSYSTTIHSFP